MTKSRSTEPPRREAPAPALTISPEKVSYIIAKAREFDVKDVVTDPDSGSNAADDAMLSVLEDHKDDPVVAELRAAIFALNCCSFSMTPGFSSFLFFKMSAFRISTFPMPRRFSAASAANCESISMVSTSAA